MMRFHGVATKYLERYRHLTPENCLLEAAGRPSRKLMGHSLAVTLQKYRGEGYLTAACFIVRLRSSHGSRPI